MIAFNTSAYLSNLRAHTTQRFDYRRVEKSQWHEWRSEFRHALEEALGLPAIRKSASGVPLAGRTEAKQDFAEYTREKLYITTEPGIEIPFYLLLPKQVSQPVPLVLCPHGHQRRGKEIYVGEVESEEEQASMEGGERDIALQAVFAGYAAIAPDVRGFWEMARKEEQESGAGNSCGELQRKALMFGRTLIGERVHDMGRLLDYAATRSEIDGSKIAITGNSGGGTVSLFTAALDERISVAAPSCYFCTFFDSIVSIHHCPCNIVPGVMNLGEMYDVAGLIAPRPVLMIAGRDDAIFPLGAVQEAFGHLREVYTAQGAAENCELFVGEGGHRYYKRRVWDFVREKL